MSIGKYNAHKRVLAAIGAVTVLGLAACTNSPVSDTGESTVKQSDVEGSGAERTSVFDPSISSLDQVELVRPDMEWRYHDEDQDPNEGTWYEGWNKRNGWAYPEGWLDWGTIPMAFTEVDWPTYEGTAFSTADDSSGQVLAKNDDGTVKSTYFLRHTFTLTQEQAESAYALEITVRYNDAMTFYVNGSPVGDFHNIPTSNYSDNMDYGAQEAVPDGEFIEETFVVDDVASLTNGYIPGEYTIEEDEDGLVQHELVKPWTDADGNSYVDITLAVELHSSDPQDTEASFELVSFIINPDESELAAASEEVKNVAVNVGVDESVINLTWNSLSSEIGRVELVEGDDPAAFDPSDAVIYEADSVEHAYTKFTSTDYYFNKATFEVERGRDYLYRVGNDDGYSSVYPLSTQDISEGYDVLFVADPQIGTGTIPTDVYGWTNTLNEAFALYPDTSFILNAGDFVDSPDKESEYDAYFEPEILASYPTVTAVGNHDVAVNYRNHFNEPNLSEYGKDEAGSDYYFTYGNILYMVLNANNLNNEEHVQFLEETAAATAGQDFEWRVVMFHQSIYAAGKQSLSEDVPPRREALVPVFDKMGVDLVLMGHDHTYARSHQMYNFEQVDDVVFEDEEQTVALSPAGTLYVTNSSASGSKYYDFVDEEYDYLAFRQQKYVPTFSAIHFGSDTLSLTSYQTDTMEVFDSYTIKK